MCVPLLCPFSDLLKAASALTKKKPTLALQQCQQFISCGAGVAVLHSLPGHSGCFSHVGTGLTALGKS